jgi:glucosylglycerol-phosphate synthase
MGSAVIANPFSHKSMDEAIAYALAMPEAEQEARMAELRASVRRHDVRAWGESVRQALATDAESSGLSAA